MDWFILWILVIGLFGLGVYLYAYFFLMPPRHKNGR